MSKVKEILDEFAVLLSYPKADYKERIARCLRLIENSQWENDELRHQLSSCLLKFQQKVAALPVEEVEELFTRTFDINPVCSLELGWHLFGETYERGAFMVQMRDLLRRSAVEESSELPDHLSHALLALGRMNEEEAASFVQSRLLRALDKMLEGFNEQDNPYEHIVKAVRELAARSATSFAGA